MREGWEYKKLGDIIRPAKVVKNGENSDLPILSITMHDGIVLQASRFKKTIASVDTSTYKVVKNGQLVIAFPIDEGLIYTQDIVEAGIMSPAYNIWDVDFTNINRQFLTIYLHCPYAMNYYKSKLRGTTMRRRSIPREDLLNMPLPVPSLSTQESIVSELDKINELISLKKEQLKDYDILAQSIFYDMFGDPVTNEKGWDTNKLETLTKSEGGGTPSKSKPEYWNGNIIWVSSKDMKSTYISDSLIHITQEGVNNSPAHLLPIGTILIVNRSGILKHTLPIAITTKEVTINQDIKALVVNSSKTNNIYLLYCLKAYSPFLLSKVKAVTVDSIDFAIFKKLPIPLPPLPLQQAFAKRIEAIEKQKQLISSEIKDLETLLASRMQYWFD